MKTEVIGITNNLKDTEEMLKFARACARVCYSEKDFEQLAVEEDKQKLLERLLKSGHHSVFEHTNITFYFDEIPKMLAMILNNEKQYATSEKSARYTQMKSIEPEQQALYDKWMGKLIPEIDKIYPQMNDSKKRADIIQKLGQENARYMTSVFTPTKMVYTMNLRQLNFIRNQLKDYVELSEDSMKHVEKNLFKWKSEIAFRDKLKPSVTDFLEQTKQFEVEELDNQTDRNISLWYRGNNEIKKSFGEVYSTVYKMSFAGLAQAHRHRTINYRIIDGTSLGAPLGIIIPEIVKESGFVGEWITDLEGVAKNDYPQAQFLLVNERGMREDFRSKMLLRMCGHAQWEIMKNTSETAWEYSREDPNFKYPQNTKCQQGMPCAGACAWTGKRALDRIV